MNQERLMQIVHAPRITEKAAVAADQNNQHVFQVACDASKLEIKKAVELMFDVKVDKVRVSNVKPKIKRFRFKEGQRQGWKKAYVTLAEGSDIDFGFGG